MVVIEVVTSDVEERSFTSKEGKPMRFREQRAYLHRPGDPYPTPFSVSLGDRPAHSPGRYSLGISSFRVGRFGSLELGRELQLQPLPAEAARPAGQDSSRPAVAGRGA